MVQFALMKFAGKHAVVTGAKGAIGSALISKLESLGISCISVDKDTEYGCDFSDPIQVDNLSRKISEEFPKIDYLFNVAGIGIYADLENLDLKEWLDSFSINVTAPFLMSKNLMKNLKKSDDALIFNVGSGMGVIPTGGRSAYCSSKFALRGLSLTLSEELKIHGVGVCHLTLGSVMTPFGTGGLEIRKKLEKKGKLYLTVKEVVTKISEILSSKNREKEYVYYPKGYSTP